MGCVVKLWSCGREVEVAASSYYWRGVGGGGRPGAACSRNPAIAGQPLEAAGSRPYPARPPARSFSGL